MYKECQTPDSQEDIQMESPNQKITRNTQVQVGG
jgi:hypothetical protein